MTAALRLAAAYNIAWGAWVILLPTSFWTLVQMPAPEYLFLWQCIGMIVGVYGVGYWIAAGDPLRHWPIVLVGLLGKVLGPLGFLDAAIRGTVPWRFGATILTNDLIWWAPFGLILWAAYRARTTPRRSAA
jgi:small multidrug resistance pump